MTQTAAEFITIELDLATTFCQLASSTANLERRERNINNAKSALRAALTAEANFDVPLREKQSIDEKISNVQSLLAELTRKGESGVPS